MLDPPAEAPSRARAGPTGSPDAAADSPGVSLRLALLGAGRMGREVAAIARERGHEIVLVVGGDADALPAPLHRSRLEDGAALRASGAQVAIDFSVGHAVPGHAAACGEAAVDLVIGTTGWEPHRNRVQAVAEGAGIGLLHAPNFSLGVNLFLRIVDEAARLVDAAGREAGLDASIHEAHHRRKLDHPSGTARRMAERVVERLGSKRRWDEGLPDGEPVPTDTLHVAVTRAGEIPGTHSLAFDGPDDRIELRHEARSRRGFARGAVVGAEWIRGRRGVFTMEDLLAATLAPESGPT